MEKQMELQTRPYINIFASALQGTPILQLRIKNTGNSTALNLSLKIQPNFYQYHEKREDHSLQELYAFSNVIEFFGPSVELIYDLGVAHTIFGAESDDLTSPTRFTVTASYSSTGKTYLETTTLDLNMFLRTTYGLSETSDQLKDISKGLGMLSDAVKSLKH